ncbi:MAG TPA: FlgD immunoglobulin-like domain containing protein [bacterium]|nr:FlgD immunoglobulin-like domain containing protein [bacterium]
MKYFVLALLVCALVCAAPTVRAGERDPSADRLLAAAEPCPPETMFTSAQSGPPRPWCGAQELWDRKVRLMGLSKPVAACPQQGACDDPAVRDATPVTPLTVRVIVHVLRNDDGTDGVSQAVVDATIAQLNADFAANGTGLSFSLTATRFHNNSALACIAACTAGDCGAALADIDAMRNLYAESPTSQCNIYISCQDSGPATLYGLGNFPWDPDALTDLGGLWINSVVAGADQHIITHEMGHTLGLWHTHHGITEVATCGPCYEFASGFEGDRRGDFCGDTPPTPVNYTCFAPGVCDCEYAQFGATQPENYMGYGPASCVHLFTAQQSRRLQCWTKAVLGSWYGAALPELHVHDQRVIRIAGGGNRWRASDTILITDANHAPVAGAAVTATYSGPSSGTLSGQTGANGRVVLTTPLKKNPSGQWCFEVTSVSRSGYAYNFGDNEVTRECESGPVFALSNDAANGSALAAKDAGTQMRAYPNPFNANTTIAVTLADDGPLVLTVCDILGRTVRRLADGHYPRGTYSFAFDGRDEHGNPLASGVYLYRLTTPGNTQTRKMVLVK